MNRIVRRGICALGVAVAGSASGIGAAGTASASEADATWAMRSDGCAYLSDGYADYQATCPQGGITYTDEDEFWDFYVARSGQWSTCSPGTRPRFTVAPLFMPTRRQPSISEIRASSSGDLDSTRPATDSNFRLNTTTARHDVVFSGPAARTAGDDCGT